MSIPNFSWPAFEILATEDAASITWYWPHNYDQPRLVAKLTSGGELIVGMWWEGDVRTELNRMTIPEIAEMRNLMADNERLRRALDNAIAHARVWKDIAKESKP